MIKTKDGYVKLIDTTYSGSANYLLQANGGAWAVHTGRNDDSNKIVRTDASGYLLTGWINTTSGDMGTGKVTRIYCSNDGYIRYKTPANFFSTLDNDENLISITIGSLNRKLTVDYSNYSGYSNYLAIHDIRGTNPTPNDFDDRKIKVWFNNTGVPSSDWWSGITVKGWTDGYAVWLLAGYSSTTSTESHLYYRRGLGTSWGNWRQLAFTTDNVASATTVKVSQHTTNNTNYPLVWTNEPNTSSVNSDLYKSWSHLYYNPSTRKLTSVGGINVGNSLLTTGTGDIYLEWWRKTNASWKILNTSGIFKFQCNYTSSVSSYYDVLTLSYNSGNASLKGDFTLGGLILRGGESSSWVKGRDYAVIRMNTSSGYSPIWSAKTTNGSWDCGTYSGNILHFSYIKDSNYNSSTNTQSADIYFNPNGLIGVNGIISTSTIRIECTTNDYQEGLTIQNADSKWCTIRLGNIKDSGTTENTWSIHRTNNNNFSISRNSSNGANGLTINKAGNVGIGYADNNIPKYRLSVNGTLRANDVFVNTGDATLKIYTGRTTNGKNDGNICFLTSIDATDGLSHAYPTLYLSRCNIVLLPRGGLVYIGTNPSTGDAAYKLYVKGNTYTTGYVSGNTLTSRVATGTAPLTVASTTKVANLNADTVDNFHASDFYEYGYVMFEHTIDASSLNQNTYYPVTFSIGSHYNVRIECRVSLNSRTKPSWSTHKGGFSVRKIWEVNGSGWGTNPVNRRILVSDYAYASADPVRGVGLLTNSSVEYVYVRGGGKYYFYTSHNISPVLRTSTYTTYSQSVSPTTTAPTAISRNVAYITDTVENADKLDGYHASSFLYSFNGTECNPSTHDGYYVGMTTKSGIDTNWWHILSMSWGEGSTLGNKTWASQLALPTQTRTGLRYRKGNGSSAYTSWIKVWDESNFNPNNYATSGHNHDSTYVNVSGDTMTGDLNFGIVETSTWVGTAPGIKWSGGSDTAYLYYNSPSSDYGLLHLNFGDDSNPEFRIDWNNTNYYRFLSSKFYTRSVYAYGYLTSESNSKTIQIGSQNTEYCHYSTTAPRHWFNKPLYVQGDIYGGSNYNLKVSYEGHGHSSYFQYRNSIASGSLNSTIVKDNGTYVVSYSGYSRRLLTFSGGGGSCSSVEFLFHYDSGASDFMQVRTSIDSNRFSDWRTIWTTANFNPNNYATSGHNHDSTYVNVSGDTMTGPLNFANATWNKVGDDVAIGDFNGAGLLGVKALNASIPGVRFFNNSGTAIGTLTSNNNTLQWNGYTIWHAGNGGSGSGLDADTVDGVHNGSLTASNIATQGNKTAISGTTLGASGVRMYQVYNNGYPTTYGNLLNIGGSGFGELLLGWTSDTSLGRLYYRSKRDIASTAWSSWGTVAYLTDNVASATNADMVDGNHASAFSYKSWWHWSGQSGLPAWLWGGNSENNYYVYNPSNFSVNYANSAGVANKLGTSNVGSSTTPIYLNGGSPTACSGVVVKYWGWYNINCYSTTTPSYSKKGGNFNFVTSVSRKSEGKYSLGTVYPSGYTWNNTIYWGSGRLNRSMSSNSAKSVLYVTIFNGHYAGSTYYLYVNTADDSSTNDGNFDVFFLCF